MGKKQPKAGAQQTRLRDFAQNREKIMENRFPLQATCASCGRQRWLKWIAGKTHVCDECKQYLEEKEDG